MNTRTLIVHTPEKSHMVTVPARYARSVAVMLPTDSTNVKAIRYVRSSESLFILFKQGAIYRYGNVPANIYHAMLKAESIGSFFHHNVRMSYEYENITECER